MSSWLIVLLCAGQWTYGSCRIGIYANLLEKAQVKAVAEGRPKSDISFVSKLLMGCTSGSIGSFIGTPSELALVRMSADSKQPIEKQRGEQGAPSYTTSMPCMPV